MSVYLDYNATAPLRPETQATMSEILAIPANPSATHSFGRAAKKILEDSRKTIAEAIGAFPNEVVFTATGSEANAMALKGFPDRRIIVSAIEHSSVAKQSDIKIPVDANGVVDLMKLEYMLGSGEPALVSVMLANNETGVIQPIREISALCKAHNALLHVDAVQALGKIPVEFTTLGCDLMTISAHKMGGPVGAAALILRQDLAITPLFVGGGQELGRRAGTENIAAIAGFARAVELIDLGQMKQLRGWLDKLETTVAQDGAVIMGKLASRLPNTSCFAMPSISNEVQLMDFDLKGFALSAGSACSSGRIEPSPVLAAMGVAKEVAGSAIRVSIGWASRECELVAFLEAWQTLQKRLKAA